MFLFLIWFFFHEHWKWTIQHGKVAVSCLHLTIHSQTFRHLIYRMYMRCLPCTFNCSTWDLLDEIDGPLKVNIWLNVNSIWLLIFSQMLWNATRQIVDLNQYWLSIKYQKPNNLLRKNSGILWPNRAELGFNVNSYKV